MDLFPIKAQASGDVPAAAALLLMAVVFVLNLALLYVVARVVAIGVRHGLGL